MPRSSKTSGLLLYKKKPYQLVHTGEKRNYFSVTSLKAYHNCNRAYFLQYIGQLKKQERADYFQFGGAIHEGLEVWALTRNLAKAEQAFVRAFKKQVSRVTVYDQATKKQRKIRPEEIKQAITDGKTILYLWSKQGYSFKPRLVEQTYLVPVRNPETKEELPLPLMVKMDMIDERDIIADYKVVRTRMKEVDWVQRTAYWIAFEEIFRRPPKLFMNCPIVKAKLMPTIQAPLTDKVTKNDKIKFFDYAKEVLDGIQAGNFKSTHQYDRLCPFATSKPILCKQ